MKHFFLSFCCFLFLSFQSIPLFSQKIDSTLSVYSDNFQQEKVHLHFDKSVYNKGETIWFKAYVMAGSDLSDYSKNFYVDWFDPAGKLLKHSMVPMFESSAKGQFLIPANYTGQSLHVRAYTKWMLNFDSAFLFNKDILVSQLNPVKAPVVDPITMLQFFPEGGDLIADIDARLAFKAANQFGKPVRLMGAIKDSKGSFIDSFATEHDGMGSLSIHPQANEIYTASWKDEFGFTNSTTLPTIKGTGANLQVQSLASKTLVLIKRSNTVEDNLQTLFLVATINQHMVYRARINLATKTTSLAEIPTTVLPTGVMQITLFNANWLPIAERVVFVNNHQHTFNPEVELPIKGLEKRARNVVEINVPDSIFSNLSIAITDAGLSGSEDNTIISQLLLCGEIKGYIHNPAYYFSSDADSVLQHLDLVMLTHGWRRYRWDDIVKGKLPTIKYNRDADFIQIKGKIYGINNIRITPDQKVILIMQGKDSSKQSLLLPIKPDGSFVQNGLVFFDTLKVYYQYLGDKRLADQGEVVFQNGLLALNRELVDRSTASPYLWALADSAQLAKSRFFAAEQARLEKLSKTTTLADVVVRTRAKRPIDLLDEKYASGLFSGDAGYQFDILNDPRTLGSMDIFHYLQGTVAGLQINFSNGTPTLTWRGGSPELFLDEVRTEPDMLNTLSMSDIAYVKVFRPPFFGAMGGGGGGAIAVYSRKGGDVKSTPGKGLGFKFLEGYTAYKQFYSPDYSQPTGNFSPDLRTTLYWNPYILTDASTHKVKIEFYNNDISKKLRIVLEGMNADGKLARVEKEIQ